MSAADEVRICRPCGEPVIGMAVRAVHRDRESGWVAVGHPDCYRAHLDSLEPEYLAASWST